MDQLEAIHQREHKRCTVLLDTRTSSRQSVSRRKRIAQILEGCQSMLQYLNVVQMARWVFYKAMDPTLHYKMKAKRL